MNRAYPVSIEDPGADCPVSLDLFARITRADPDALSEILDGMPEVRRARLAVWLYGRSHTREIGIQVAAACEGSVLRRVAGLLGNVLYDLSRLPSAEPSHSVRTSTGRQVSLGGSRPMPQRSASA